MLCLAFCSLRLLLCADLPLFSRTLYSSLYIRKKSLADRLRDKIILGIDFFPRYALQRIHNQNIPIYICIFAFIAISTLSGYYLEIASSVLLDTFPTFRHCRRRDNQANGLVSIAGSNRDGRRGWNNKIQMREKKWTSIARHDCIFHDVTLLRFVPSWKMPVCRDRIRRYRDVYLLSRRCREYIVERWCTLNHGAMSTRKRERETMATYALVLWRALCKSRKSNDTRRLPQRVTLNSRAGKQWPDLQFITFGRRPSTAHWRRCQNRRGTIDAVWRRSRVE